MPYKCEKIKIAGTEFDLRRKLTDLQKNAIKLLSKQGISQRKLAEIFHCSKRTVQNILQPQERSAPAPKPKEYWTEKKCLYRQRKQKLYVEGRLSSKRKKK